MSWDVIRGSKGSEERAVKRSAGAPSRTHDDRIKVLVVDDEPSICKALSIALSRVGFEVLTTQSGESAQQLLAAQRVDVLVLDLRIPDMRGDVIYHLAVGMQPHLAGQTLFLTGDVSERAQKLIAACGCHFLTKPFQLTDVIEAIRALVPRRHSSASA
jgi:DNA-binding response OmpR family regulator